jgi:hypothetical protein
MGLKGFSAAGKEARRRLSRERSCVCNREAWPNSPLGPVPTEELPVEGICVLTLSGKGSDGWAVIAGPGPVEGVPRTRVGTSFKASDNQDAVSTSPPRPGSPHTPSWARGTSTRAGERLRTCPGEGAATLDNAHGALVGPSALSPGSANCLAPARHLRGVPGRWSSGAVKIARTSRACLSRSLLGTPGMCDAWTRGLSGAVRAQGPILSHRFPNSTSRRNEHTHSRHGRPPTS